MLQMYEKKSMLVIFKTYFYSSYLYQIKKIINIEKIFLMLLKIIKM